ncbi:MAG: hypothetical protein J2O39_09440, partial [Acidimicrobiales bacterium]|nr:hypothetical protein [Acidimicrobiales bacterium]
MPWLWLFGASGAGKSAAGFELYRQLAAEGRRVGFVDLDQIGICLPDDDPVRGPIKAANLHSALRSFAEVGAEGVVVAGDVSGPPMQRILDLSAEAPPRTVRLRASAGEYERRLRRRGAPASVIARAKAHDTRFPRAGDIDVDTEGRDVAEVARAIRCALPDWPRAKAPRTGRVEPLR